MRNKLLHKQAKNLRRRKNWKAGRPKLEDGLLMQMENKNYLLDVSQPLKGLTEADFFAWTAEIANQRKDFPIPCCLHSLLNSPRAPSLCNRSEAKDNHATLLIKLKETLSSSLARAVLSFSRERAHGGCIHSPGLASQSLSGLQCCSIFRMALLIL